MSVILQQHIATLEQLHLTMTHSITIDQELSLLTGQDLTANMKLLITVDIQTQQQMLS